MPTHCYPRRLLKQKKGEAQVNPADRDLSILFERDLGPFVGAQYHASNIERRFESLTGRLLPLICTCLMLVNRKYMKRLICVKLDLLPHFDGLHTSLL